MKALAAVALCVSTLILSDVAPAAQETASLEASIQGQRGPYVVNTLLIHDAAIENAPLVVISHGGGSDPRSVQIESLMPQAKVFSEMGFMVLIVERKGFGRSLLPNIMEGGGVDCGTRNYKSSGEIAARDILGAISFLKTKFNFDSNRVLLIGYSTGGFSSIYAGFSDEPAIKAVVNVSGGRGAESARTVCNEKGLVDAMEYAGQRYKAKGQTTPTLWIYSQNDKSFDPELAGKMLNAFKAGGGQAEMVKAPSFSSNGHSMFIDPAGMKLWVPSTKSFLKSNNF